MLVIEAGYENTPLECKVPLTFGKLFHSKYDWDYNTTPQNDNLHKREMFWPRGKILGGSSSINAMMYQEGARTDYQEWEERLGCKGYGPEEMKAYHRRVENYTPNKNRPALDHAHRSANAGGVLQTSHSWLSEITEKGFLEGAKTIGLKEVKDINTPDELSGVVRFMTFIDQKGQRSSAATAYLPPAVQRRPNLTIALETRVTRILFDTSSGKEPEAIGVEVQTDPKNPLFQVAARKEVLVCGGTINTPQTLLLSGVGPAEELRKHNLPVIVESPNVGKRMKDHLFTSPICVRSRPDKTLDYLTSDVRALPALGRWLTTGTGPLTSNVGEVAAFFNTVTDKRLPTTVEGVTKEENKPENNGSMGVGPDIEVIATPLCYRDHGAVTAPSGHGILGFVPIGLRPRSEGTVTLKTTSVWDKALIDPKYLSDEKNNDQKVLLAGLRVCIKIMQSEAIQQYALPVEKSDDIDNFYWPYCATDYHKITDEQLLTWLGKEGELPADFPPSCLAFADGLTFSRLRSLHAVPPRLDLCARPKRRRRAGPRDETKGCQGTARGGCERVPAADFGTSNERRVGAGGEGGRSDHGKEHPVERRADCEQRCSGPCLAHYLDLTRVPTRFLYSILSLYRSPASIPI